MALLNGMYILVESEEPDFDNDITDQPVEKGIALTDHVQRKARTMPVSGVIVGEDAAQIRERLVYLSDNGSIVEYIGRNYFIGLITGLRTGHHNRIANGFTFSFTLKEVRVTESSYVETLPLPIKAQVTPVISSGRKQKKNKTKGKGKKKDEVQKVKFKAGSPWAEG